MEIPPEVAVNTTAGTGAEMTRFCIITDEVRHVKPLGITGYKVVGGQCQVCGLRLPHAMSWRLNIQRDFLWSYCEKRIKKVSSEFHWEVSASNASLLAMCDNMQQILVG